MSAMKAVVVDAPGGVEVLRCRSIRTPTPAEGECLIEVLACGVCSHDIATRNGTLRRGVEMPVICGHEIAGRISAVGAKVSEWVIGDEVVSTQRRHVCGDCKWCRTGRETLCPRREFLGDVGLNGGYAEFVLVDEGNLARKPAGVSFEEACIVACTVGSELNAIRDVAHLRAGETVLITGAGGGLGIHGVQVAKAVGARVLALTTSEAKRGLLEHLGAEVVVARDADFSREVRELTDGEGVDVAIDNVGTSVFHGVRRSMGVAGRWVLVGQLSGEFVSFNPAQLFLSGISLLSAISTTRTQLTDALRLVERGHVRPIVAETFPLEKAAEAHTLVESGRLTGRAVLVR